MCLFISTLCAVYCGIPVEAVSPKTLSGLRNVLVSVCPVLHSLDLASSKFEEVVGA